MVISKIIHLGTTLRNLYTGYIIQAAVAKGVTVELATAFTMAQVKTMSLWGVIKGLGETFMSTPIGWISVVLGLGAAITAATDAWQKNVAASQEALKANEENIQQYQSELDSLEQLQKKLQEAQGDKKALAAIQGELNNTIGETVGLLNGEAEAYKIATINLQAQINAKKKLIAQEQQEAVNNNKAIFDVIWVAGSIVLSFIFFEGKLIGTREGTVISAIFVGITVKIYKPIIEKPLTKLIKR